MAVFAAAAALDPYPRRLNCRPASPHADGYSGTCHPDYCDDLEELPTLLEPAAEVELAVFGLQVVAVAGAVIGAAAEAGALVLKQKFAIGLTSVSGLPLISNRHHLPNLSPATMTAVAC